MRIILTILGLSFMFLTCGQTNNDTIKIIAKLVSPGQGSKVYIAKYQVIKNIKGKVTNDTIQVGYYSYNEFENAPDTALLTLNTYSGSAKTKDYYIFPDYNAKKGIEKVRISKVDFDYWEGCETGENDCKPLTFYRNSINEKWFLLMPCGGTATTVTLSKHQGITKENEITQKCEITHSECPPVFELTNLEDGKYYAYMLACGLGGQIEINIKTDYQMRINSNNKELKISLDEVDKIFISAYCSPMDSCRYTRYQLNDTMTANLISKLNKSKLKSFCDFDREYLLYIHLKNGLVREFIIKGALIKENNECYVINDSNYFENLWIELDREWIELNNK